jgi:hypothetical protein
MDWSPSKLLRIENGSVAISTTDLRALLGHYGVEDSDKVDDLVQMGQIGRRQTASLRTYQDILAPGFLTFLNYEGAASLIRSFQPSLVPGLLQTEEYARAIIRALSRPTSNDVIERRVHARMERQELLLERADPPELFFVLDESVVRRHVGGKGVMRRQLEALGKWASQPHVTIQIIPLSVGEYPGMLDPFVILEFPDPADDNLMYIEDYRGDLVLRDQSEEISRYLENFWELENKASRPEEIGRYIDAAITALDGSAAPAERVAVGDDI